MWRNGNADGSLVALWDSVNVNAKRPVHQGHPLIILFF